MPVAADHSRDYVFRRISRHSSNTSNVWCRTGAERPSWWWHIDAGVFASGRV